MVGRSEPERVHELLGRKGQADAELVQRFEAGLSAYREQDWETAEAAFQSCLQRVPGDRPGQVFLERIAAFRETPPPADWDGIWVATRK